MRDYDIKSYSIGTITYIAGQAAGGTVLCRSGAGYLGGFLTYGIGSGACTLTIYDGLAASADIIIDAYATGSSSTNVLFCCNPIKFSTGLYVASAGSVKATILHMY